VTLPPVPKETSRFPSAARASGDRPGEYMKATVKAASADTLVALIIVSAPLKSKTWRRLRDR
jgi:hypothetical protein